MSVCVTGSSGGNKYAWSRPTSQVYGAGGMTSRVRSRPIKPGLAFALATRLASSRSIVDRIPFIAPCSRVRRTRARVSIPRDADDAVLFEKVGERSRRAVIAHSRAEARGRQTRAPTAASSRNPRR